MAEAIINGFLYGIPLGYVIWRITDHFLSKSMFKQFIKDLGELAKFLEEANKEMGND